MFLEVLVEVLVDLVDLVDGVFEEEEEDLLVEVFLGGLVGVGWRVWMSSREGMVEVGLLWRRVVSRLETRSLRPWCWGGTASELAAVPKRPARFRALDAAAEAVS